MIYPRNSLFTMISFDEFYELIEFIKLIIVNSEFLGFTYVIQSASYINTNIYYKSSNLPNSDVYNYSKDLR